MPSLKKVLVPFAAVLALAGCGEGAGADRPAPADEENAVRFLMPELQAASRDGDGDRICNRIFTPRPADSVTSASESGSCAEEVRENLFSPQVRIGVEDVELADSTNATATVKEQNGKTSRVLLAKQNGEWRVRGVEPA